MNVTAMRAGRIVLYRITEQNTAEIRERLCQQPQIDDVLHEFDTSYQPRYDAEGRQTRFGFYSTLDGELAGLSLLVVSSWHNARGYTGADTIPHMRGRGVTPGSKPHLFYLAFELLGLNRVETGCFVSNTSSRRSLEKTPGLRLEGVLREFARNEQGEFEDEYRYAILRRDYLAHYDPSQIELM